MKCALKPWSFALQPVRSFRPITKLVKRDIKHEYPNTFSLQNNFVALRAVELTSL